MTTISPLKQNVDKIQLDQKEIYLVGTAHISSKSVELAEEMIREIQPDSVAVELCEPRYKALQDPDRWKKTDIFTVIKQKKMYLLMSQLILSGFQKKLGKSLDIKPGAEMMKSVEVANEIGSEIVLADREVRTTLKRTWSSMSFWSATKLMAAMVGSIFTTQELSEEGIERLKSSDALSEMMKELSDAIPGVQKALIDERDKYLAQKIKQSPGNKVVAIIGAGHIPGIKSYISQEIDLDPLEVIPPPGKLGKIISWGIPALVIGLMISAFFTSGADKGVEMFASWAIANALFAAVGAAIAFAHPITILAAAIAAPFTSLNPLIAAGWVAGLVEAFIRKPRVEDLESIADDMGSAKGIWGNRVSRTLLVIALTNVGSIIGTGVGITWITKLFGK